MMAFENYQMRNDLAKRNNSNETSCIDERRRSGLEKSEQSIVGIEKWQKVFQPKNERVRREKSQVKKKHDSAAGRSKE